MTQFSEFIASRLRCPVCAGRLALDGADYRCSNGACGQRYPIVDGVPVVINERSSIFSLADFLERRDTYFAVGADPHDWRAAVARLLYESSSPGRSVEILTKLASILEKRQTARVLVIGAGVDPERLVPLQTVKNVEIVGTDVSLSGNIAMICDAHDLPFDDETFDAVVAEAVLEHVVDPYRCAAEIHRVLRADGLVFADTPFIQQVHGGRYDFTRFTHLGHRRLFRRFEEIESGASSGPAVALSWSFRYFLLSFATSKTMTRVMRVLAKLGSFWWKYFDAVLISRPGALDAAGSFYFLGRKSETTMSDRDLVRSYRGVNQRF